MSARTSAGSSTATRLVLFAVGAVAVFGLAAGLGKAVSPSTDNADDAGHAGGAGHEDGHDHAADPSTPAASYRLAAARTDLAAGEQQFGFRILDAAGQPVTSYTEQHERLLHLVVVRTDLGGYRHLHPTLDEATGQWTTPLDLGAGKWRAYADFAPAGGEKAVATADLDVRGSSPARALGPDTASAAVDGFDAHLRREGQLLALHVSKDGKDVTDLQPYLGAFGHLVAIRADDLSYLHVHPQDGPAGPEVAFHADLGAAGRYRLFFEFRHGGAVHRAEFTVSAGEEHDGEHDH